MASDPSPAEEDGKRDGIVIIMKVSVIDLGYNSVKMVNYDVKRNGTFNAYGQQGFKVKLGLGLDKGGYLSGEPVRRTIEALKLFRDTINLDSIRHVLPVATSVVRDALNRDSFLEHVHKETGFRFKVLSSEEEALYSYVGALESTCLPTSLFFDLGGGSLELVYTENYSIKKIESYPLGALYLSKLYRNNDKKASDRNDNNDNNNSAFSKKAYSKMEKYITDLLPDRKEFGISVDTALVGVGGTLRAIARYEHALARYELDKIHNYRMGYDSVSAIAKQLRRMEDNELAGVKAIGSNRVDTIVAGSSVISLLMQKMDFDKVVVSTRGLREGILSVFLRDERIFYNNYNKDNRDAGNESITTKQAKAYVVSACKHKEAIPQYARSLIIPLVSANLLREKEQAILAHALNDIATLPAVANLSNLFYTILDEDNAFLTHREQLILALAIIHTRKEKTADWLFSRYRYMLEPNTMKVIERISACIILSEILEKTKAMVHISISDNKKVHFRIFANRRAVPEMLLANTLENFEHAFGASTSHKIVTAARNKSTAAATRKKLQDVKVIT